MPIAVHYSKIYDPLENKTSGATGENVDGVLREDMRAMVDMSVFGRKIAFGTR